MILRHMGKSFRETFPTRASEWALGTMLTLWGIILTSNTDLFDDSPSLYKLGEFAPQSTWALLCLIAGVGRLAMLAVNGSWRRSPHLRAVSAFISCFFWFKISHGLVEAGTFGTGLAVYPVLFLLDVYNTIRAAGDSGTADRRYTGAHNGPDA